MKKLILAAAIASALASPAFAVNVDDGTGAVNFATELVVPGTTVLTGGGLNSTATMGFGVSAGQTRFVRFQLTGGTFGAALSSTDLTVTPGAIPGGTAVTASNITIVQGGGAGSNFVVFQVTANGTGVLQSDVVSLTLGTVGVIPASSASVSLSYALYADAPSAASGGSGGRLNVLNTTSQVLAGLVTGVSYAVAPATSTADVSESSGAYRKFLGSTNTLTTTIGTVTLGAATGVLNPATGAQVAFAALAGAATSLTLTGADLTAAAGTNAANTGLFLAGTGTCAAPVGANIPATRTNTSVTFVTGSTALVATPICYTASGASAIAAQDFSLAGSVAAVAGPPASTGNTLTGQAAGSFIRNGTVLKAAFADTISTGNSVTVYLSNTSASVANFTTSCLTPTGRVAGTGTTTSVAANSGTRIGVNSATGLGCPSNTRGIELTFSVPNGSVIGSVSRLNAATGINTADSMTGNQ